MSSWADCRIFFLRKILIEMALPEASVLSIGRILTDRGALVPQCQSELQLRQASWFRLFHCCYRFAKFVMRTLSNCSNKIKITNEPFNRLRSGAVGQLWEQAGGSTTFSTLSNVQSLLVQKSWEEPWEATCNRAISQQTRLIVRWWMSVANWRLFAIMR